MKNKLIIVAVLILIVILIGVWLYPSDNSTEEKEEVTGRAITTEEVEETEEEPEVKTQDEEESEVDDIPDDELVSECLTICGAEAKTSLEVDIWKSICNKKYKLGEEEIRDFIKTC